MFIYLSDFTDVTIGGRTRRAATAAKNGEPIVQLGPNRCLVATAAQLSPVPTGVTFLLDYPSGINTAVPNAIRNAINTRLGTSIPAGRTWKQLFNLLADGGPDWAALRDFRNALSFFPLGEIGL